MRTFTSAEAKNNFGELIDMVRAAPVAITKYDRAVVVVMAVEEFERLKALGITDEQLDRLIEIHELLRLARGGVGGEAPAGLIEGPKPIRSIK